MAHEEEDEQDPHEDGDAEQQADAEQSVAGSEDPFAHGVVVQVNDVDAWNALLDVGQNTGSLIVLTLHLVGCHPSEQVAADATATAQDFPTVVFAMIERAAYQTGEERRLNHGSNPPYQQPPGAQRVYPPIHESNAWVGVYRNRERIDQQLQPDREQLRALVEKHVHG